MGKKHLPGVGERHPSRCADEQGSAELSFQHPDLAAHGRLRDPKTERGATDVTFFRDGDEVLNLGEAHGIELSYQRRTGNRPR